MSPAPVGGCLGISHVVLVIVSGLLTAGGVVLVLSILRGLVHVEDQLARWCIEHRLGVTLIALAGSTCGVLALVARPARRPAAILGFLLILIAAGLALASFMQTIGRLYAPQPL